MILLLTLLACPPAPPPPPLPGAAAANLPPTPPPPVLPGPDPSATILADIAAKFADSRRHPSGAFVPGAPPPP